MCNSLYSELLQNAAAENIKRFAVGAAVFNESGELLVVKRNPDDALPNLYEVPGGGVEPGESLEAAVARELVEETGLVMDRIINYVGSFDYNLEVEGKQVIGQFSFVVNVPDIGDIILTEHQKYKWIKNTEGLVCTKEMKALIDSVLNLA